MMSDQANRLRQARRLRTLPSQTDATYWVIVLIIMAVFTASLIGGSPVCMAPIVLSMFILPIRAILARPGKELARQDLEATERLTQSDDLQRLQTTVDEIAAEIAFKGKIQIIISQDPFEARAFGSWRRHYILLGNEIARQLAWDLQQSDHREKARALLGHEIGHLHHRDVQHIGYTRELLRACFVVLPWWGFFLIGWLGFSFLTIDGFLSFEMSQVEAIDSDLAAVIGPLVEPLLENRAEIAEKAETISFSLVVNFLVNSLWPILFVGFILWLFYWRRMIRLQEYQADNLAQMTTGTEATLLNAFGRYPAWFAAGKSGPNRVGRFQDAGKKLVFRFEDQLFSFSSTAYDAWDVTRSRIRHWFSLHPTYQERLSGLRSPTGFQEGWLGIGGSIAILTLALSILLISPLSSYHPLGNPTFLATIATVILLSTWMLPFILDDRPIVNQLAKILALVFGVRAIFVIVDRLLVLVLVALAPRLLGEMFNGMILAIARYSKPIDAPPLSNPFEALFTSIPVYLTMQLLIPFCTVLLLLLTYYLLQRDAAKAFLAGKLLEDQLENQLENRPEVNWRRRHWVLLLSLSITALTLIMLPLSEVLMGKFSTLYAPDRIVSYALGLMSLTFLLIFHFKTKSRPDSSEEQA